MATARSAAGWISAAFVVAVVAVAVVSLRISNEASPAATAVDAPAPVDVEAESIYHFDSLESMVQASDAVVLATVQSVERGRLVGDPADGGIISRIVTLSVERVLSGAPAPTVLVEEEGWLADGTPIVVNGVEPSAVGDRGVWFLDAIDDAELPVLLVINSQGRFLVEGDGALRGGDQRDSLVQELQRLTLDELLARVAVSS